jgi:hypothetical protein
VASKNDQQTKQPPRSTLIKVCIFASASHKGLINSVSSILTYLTNLKQQSMNLYILTSDEYKSLTDVSFLSEAPTEAMQKALKTIGTKATLPLLMGELKRQGYKSNTNK